MSCRTIATNESTAFVDHEGRDGYDTRLRVPLGRLWDRYRRECETFRDTDQTHQSDTATRAALLIAYFGVDYDVERLSKDAQRRYERARLAGGLRYHRDRHVLRCGRVHTEVALHVSQPTRARCAEADLVPLHAMLNWATTVRGPNGARWLAANPLKGIERRPERNPRRPSPATSGSKRRDVPFQHEQFGRLRGRPINCGGFALNSRLYWSRPPDGALAIRQLRWEDIDYAAPAIKWRADGDKMGVLWTIDLSEQLVAELRSFQARLCGVGGWVFPATRFPDQVVDRWAMVKWLLEAERDAALPKLMGGVWHPYRRKWAIER